MRRRKPPPDLSPPVDEWAYAPPAKLEAAQHAWWRDYNRVRSFHVDTRSWVETHPFPGGRGCRYAHLRVPASWRSDG